MSIVRVLGVARHRAAAEALLFGLGSVGFPLAHLSVLLRPVAGAAGTSSRSPIVSGGTFGPLVGVRSVASAKAPMLSAGPIAIADDGVPLFGTTREQSQRYLELLETGGVLCAVEIASAGDAAAARGVFREQGIAEIATASSHPT